MQRQAAVKLAIGGGIAALFAAAYPYLKEYASLEYIQAQHAAFQAYYAQHQAAVLAGYFGLYVAVTALSLPGAAILTLLAGALFGLVTGVILVSFASSIGATLAFLAARFLIGDALQKRYGGTAAFQKINAGVESEGAFYLFTMRLIPAFPFFLVNLLMALTRLPAATFYWVSQVGMFLGTIVFVYAGTELAKISSVKEILSPTLIAAFVAIGVLPLASKKIVALLRRRAAPAQGK